MTSHRLFFIGHNEHSVGVGVVDCPMNDDAIAAARRSCGEHRAVEVWELARRVGVVDDIRAEQTV